VQARTIASNDVVIQHLSWLFDISRKIKPEGFDTGKWRDGFFVGAQFYWAIAARWQGNRPA
jgi:hypothetical protein